MVRLRDDNSVRALARKPKGTEADGAARRRTIRGKDPLTEKPTDSDLLNCAAKFGDNGHTHVPRDFVPRK